MSSHAKAATPEEMGWTKASGDGVDCSWINASWIACNDYIFSFDVTASTGNAAVFKLSATGAKVLTGISTLNGYENLGGSQKEWYIILNGSSTSGIIATSANATSGGATGTIKDDNRTGDLLLATGGSENSSDPAGRDYNPTSTTTNSNANTDVEVHLDGSNKVYAVCGLFTKPGQHCYSTSGGNGISGKDWNLVASAPDVTKATSGILDSIQSRDNCTQDSGAIGFVLCPILETTNNAVRALTGDGNGKGFLVELLTVKPLVANSSDPIYRAWEGIRNIALGLYIVVFALIVFGNGVGYDPYTIKRALPRLAIGVLLTFASFFIVQTLVDLSNIIGNSIPAFLAQLTGVTGLANYSLSLNFAAGAIAIILWIILLFVALGALLIGIAGLVTRLIIIYALVLLGPIAFVAWVLPNTEGMFKKWWSNLIKVLMMFPIVTGMLSLAILFQNVILSTQPGGGGLGGGVSESTTQIIAAVAPLIAIILIPKTFKWGGDLFIAAAGYVAGKASAGKDFSKKSALESSKSGRVGQTLNKMAEVPGLGRVPGIGGLTNRQKYATVAKRQAAFTKKMGDGLDKVTDDNLVKLHSTQKKRDGSMKNTPYATAVDNELKARRGKALSEYAQNYRDGRFEDAGRNANKLRKIDAALGQRGDTETALTGVRKRIDDSTGGPPSADRVSAAIGDTTVGIGGTTGGGGGTTTATGRAARRAGRAVGGVVSGAQERWNNRNQGGFIDPAEFTGRNSSESTPDEGATTPSPQPQRQTPPRYNGPAVPWQPAPQAPPTASAPPIPPTPTAPSTPPPAPSYSGSAGGSVPPAPSGGGTPMSAGTTTQVINNNSVSQVFQQSGTIRTQMAAGGGIDGYGDLMRKMDGIDAKLASGRVDSFTLKKDLKSLRMARDSAPESMHGQIDEYMRSAERAAGLPEKAGDHDDVDLGDE